MYVPDRVNASQVFYQQSPANRDHNQNDGAYNLWGEVPVKNASTYFNLTPAGIVHGGNNGVYAWYQLHVVPLLGDGAPELSQVTLTSKPTNATGSAPAQTSSATSTTPVAPAADSSNPTYSGTAEPGATVSIRVGAANTNHLRTVAQTVANSTGAWTAAINEDLAAGRYRVIATTIIGTVPLGPLVINATYPSRR